MSMLQNRIGALIPLYVNPTSPMWDQVISAKINFPSVPMAVVININSGPGTSVNANFTALIDRLRQRGIITLGYVWTDLGNASEASVRAVMDTWKSLYPALDGIFFAGMSNQTSKQAYYDSLHNYARTTKGFTTTVGHAGVKVPVSFLNGNTTDTIVVYEGAGVPNPTLYEEYASAPNNNLGLLPYGIAALNGEWIAQVNAYAGWVYMTSDTGMNPWDTLPPYFNTLIQTIDQIGSGTTVQQNVDNFGIQKIYHTKTGGEEWYVNMNDPTSDERFQNEPGLTRQSDGSWQYSGSSMIRIEAWSPAYSDQTRRQAARWLNVEITGYLKHMSGTASNYNFQVYSRGGHHFTNVQCEGSALKCRIYVNGNVGFVKEVCHPAYAGNRGVNSGFISGGSNNKWLGIKHVIYNIVEGGNIYTKQEAYIDRNVQDIEGNLVIRNDWEFASSYIDRGGWDAGGSDFDNNCDGCGRATDEILIEPGGNTRSGTSNYNRNLVAWRTDGISYRFKFLSAREIDPTRRADGQTPLPNPSEPGTVFDNFGVRKIYPTESGGDEWYQNTVNFASNTRLVNFTNSVTRNADGSWKCRDTNVLIQVAQINGYNESTTFTAAQNHSTLRNRGVMQDERDWRNVEMTIYFRINATPSDSSFDLYARGGRHVDPQPWCEGSALHGTLRSDGSTRLTKEQWHLSTVFRNQNNLVNESIIGRWIGMKYVVYNRNLNGVLVTKQEIYVDLNNDNTWVKLDETSDAGGWGTQGASCQGAVDQIISWGGPIAAFSWNTFTDVDFQKMSVREIDGDAVPVDTPPPPSPGHCGSP